MGGPTSAIVSEIYMQSLETTAITYKHNHDFDWELNKNHYGSNLLRNQSNAWDAWRWRKYTWLAIHDGAITLGVSLHKKMTEAGTQPAEPIVILTTCLFSFVAGEHERSETRTSNNES